MKTRYPIFIPSRGRHDVCLTAKMFRQDDVSFKIVVEPKERQLYLKRYREEELLTLPFNDRGLPVTRNWIWEYAISKNYEKHWQIDDNISRMTRLYKSKRIKCNSGVAIRVAEDFTDRYENVGLSGFEYYCFSRETKKPFRANVHVYSIFLIDNSLPYRFRGHVNEDVDLCLQILSGGLCTIQISAFAADKKRTMTMKGGNEDLYKADGRLQASRFLEKSWPGVVKVNRRFKRPHHIVKGSWRAFNTPLKKRTDIDKAVISKPNEYGLKLKQTKSEIKSPNLKKIFNAWKEGQNGKRS